MQWRALNARARKIRLCEQGVFSLDVIELRVGQVRAGEVAHGQLCARKIAARHVGIGELSELEALPSEVSASEV